MIGTQLSHYRITAKLGEGGMGVVYRAEDLDLKRDVALKVLPQHLAADPSRLGRFRREAESVAALNHPNIVTIHSVEESDGVHFLTMELVEGESLDRALPPGGLPLPKALDIALGIAEALAVAHERGVVHRDLKPGNVMLLPDGRVKVLDFGLAKLAATAPADPDERTLEMAADAAPLTGEGVILGTAPYMSPEQAKGQPVDRRSDIFSLGSILYEVATGIRPFAGESSVDTLHRVIHDEPEPLDRRIPQAPPQLQWILRKALAKDPGERYQSAGDLAVDLRAVRRDVDSATSALSGASPLTTSSHESLGEGRSRRPLIVMLAAIGVVALIAGLFWTLGRSSVEPSGPQAAAPQPLSIRPLTASGIVIDATISPDGRLVAYVESSQGMQSLHLRQVGASQSLELVPPASVGYWGTAFSPDSTQIVYGLKDRAHPQGAFYRISALGGTARQLASGLDSRVTFSPDGERMAWLRARHPEPAQSALMVADGNGSDPRVLAAVAEPDSLAPRFFTAPSWSPDGRLIAASLLDPTREAGGRVVAFDAETGEVAWTSQSTWPWLSMVAWLPAGDGLLVVGETEDLSGTQIWLLPYPNGPKRRITQDLFEYRTVNLTADGETLLTIPADRSADIWAMPSDGSERPRKISRGLLDGYYGFSVAPDDRIVFQTLEAGQLDLAIMNPDGSDRALLTEDPEEDRYPTATDDGRVIWMSRTVAGIRLMEMDLAGSKPVPVLEDALVDFAQPAVAAGVGVVFEHRAGGFPSLWKVPPSASRPEQLTDYFSRLPAISHDGQRLAFVYSEPDGPLRIGIAGIEGGRPFLSLDQPMSLASGSFVRWTFDDQALLINTVANDRTNLWRLPLDGGAPTQITDFDEKRVLWADYSKDGRTLYVTRGLISRDAVLIQNFR